MKRITALLCVAMLLLGLCSCADQPAVSDGSQAAESSQEEKKGLTFSMEGIRPESMENIWVCPMPLNNGTVKSDFIDMLTDKSKWPTVFEKTTVIKLYIEQIAKTSTADLKRLGEFVTENKLAVAVELGGVRVAPVATPDDEIGVTAAQSEFLTLSKFILAGGRVDYITTDHALAEEITGRKDTRPEMTMQDYMKQQMLYFQYMQQQMPNLKVGSIESLGFFWIKGDRQYGATDPTLERVDFETYLDEYLRIAQETGITLDHFHIDFGMQDVEHDGGYGRILVAEDYVQSKGMKCGFVAANCFHKPMTTPAPDEEKASQSAAERTLQYFEGYMQAGGHSDYLLFQRWQPYPVPVGDENEPLSSFGIFKAMVESPYFPKAS